MASLSSSGERIQRNHNQADAVIESLAKQYSISLGEIADGPVLDSRDAGDPRRMNIQVRISDREARLVAVIEKLGEHIAQLEQRLTEVESKGRKAK